MNEWVLVGIVAIGSLLLIGGGAWVRGMLAKKDSPPSPRA